MGFGFGGKVLFQTQTCSEGWSKHSCNTNLICLIQPRSTREKGMTEVVEKVMGQFPIDELCFILAAGLVTIMTFPFDIIRLLSSSANINWAELSSIISNFEPFVNLQHVLASEHVAELFVVFLLSSVLIGILIYLSAAAFEKANDLLGMFLKKYKCHPKRLVLWMSKIASKEPCEMEKSSVSNPSDDNDEFETAHPFYKLKFYEWLRMRKVDRYVLLLWTMRRVSTALLFCSEIFWVLALLSAALSHIWLLVAWSSFIVVVTYFFFYATFEIQYEKSHKVLYKTFRKYPYKQILL